jgi:hypothetical protein
MPEQVRMIDKGQDSGARLRHGHGLDITTPATTAYRVLFLRNVCCSGIPSYMN